MASTIEIHCLSSGGQSSDQGVGRVGSLRGCKGKPASHLLPACCGFAGVSGVSWLLELRLHLHMALFWGMSVPKFPLFIRTAAINMTVDRVLLCSGMTSS